MFSTFSVSIPSLLGYFRRVERCRRSFAGSQSETTATSYFNPFDFLWLYDYLILFKYPAPISFFCSFFCFGFLRFSTKGEASGGG